ncbi:transcriptional regulator [Meridianimarinicoccus roseus]|uniref:Transcriptional regulator n=1 Tax=Meridianimarinicoccus roseus TaxID=2072018 RepID=A0A2V2LFS8_9RHOB|nr:LysR family transcriptional regulator [Meridianimarinicoccus roseus]PWR02096.1 transcriptional regulator [Meridianimarinicoccus roseus]
MSSSLSNRLKPSHLRLIRAINDWGKLQLAADAVGMSQPAASRMLSDIEADAGGALFDRLPRGMVPTAVGAAFVRRARIILAEVEALDSEIEQLRTGLSGAVRVGAVTGPAVGALVPALTQMRQKAPEIRPTVEVAPSVTLIRGLEEGRFDFVLARLGANNDTRSFHAYPGRTEEVSLVVRSTHPLADRVVSLSGTLPFEFVIQEPGSPIRTALEKSFLEHRLPTPSKVTNSSSLLIALSYIAVTDAIAPQTREVAQLLTRTNSALSVIETEEDITVSSFLVLHHRHHPLSPLAKNLLHEVLQRM